MSISGVNECDVLVFSLYLEEMCMKGGYSSKEVYIVWKSSRFLYIAGICTGNVCSVGDLLVKW